MSARRPAQPDVPLSVVDDGRVAGLVRRVVGDRAFDVAGIAILSGAARGLVIVVAVQDGDREVAAVHPGAARRRRAAVLAGARGGRSPTVFGVDGAVPSPPPSKTCVAGTTSTMPMSTTPPAMAAIMRPRDSPLPRPSPARAAAAGVRPAAVAGTRSGAGRGDAEAGPVAAAAAARAGAPLPGPAADACPPCAGAGLAGAGGAPCRCRQRRQRAPRRRSLAPTPRVRAGDGARRAGRPGAAAVRVRRPGPVLAAGRGGGRNSGGVTGTGRRRLRGEWAGAAACSAGSPTGCPGLAAGCPGFAAGWPGSPGTDRARRRWRLLAGLGGGRQLAGVVAG